MAQNLFIQTAYSHLRVENLQQSNNIELSCREPEKKEKKTFLKIILSQNHRFRNTRQTRIKNKKIISSLKDKNHTITMS